MILCRRDSKCHAKHGGLIGFAALGVPAMKPCSCDDNAKRWRNGTLHWGWVGEKLVGNLQLRCSPFFEKIKTEAAHA